MSKKDTISKKVKKAPVVTKQNGVRAKATEQALKKAQEDHVKHGTTATALALRKAQKNFKGD